MVIRLPASVNAASLVTSPPFPVIYSRPLSRKLLLDCPVHVPWIKHPTVVGNCYMKSLISPFVWVIFLVQYCCVCVYIIRDNLDFL